MSLAGLLTDVYKLLLNVGVKREWVTPGYSEDLSPFFDFDFNFLTIENQYKPGFAKPDR